MSLSLQALEAFAQGGPLPEAALHALTKEFFTNARFDPIADRLVDTSPAPTALYTVMPAPYISSNPAVAKAITDYRAALDGIGSPAHSLPT